MSVQMSSLATANQQASAAIEVLLRSIQEMGQSLQQPAQPVPQPSSTSGKGNIIDLMA